MLEIAAIGGKAGAKEGRGAIALVNGKEKEHCKDGDYCAGEGVENAYERELPVTRIGKPGENEGRRKEECKCCVADRHDGDGKQCERKEYGCDDELRVKRDGEQSGEDTTTDGSANALETSTERSRDVGLKDDQRSEQQPIAVIDVEQQDNGDVESAYQGNAQSVAEGERAEGEIRDEEIKDGALA